MKLTYLFAALALALVVSCANANVLTLGEADFDGALADNDLILVKFYAPWCGHCKKLAPEWDAAADELAEAGERGVLAKVDCTENQELCARFGVRGYPTLKLFVNGDDSAPADYQGERTAPAITAFMRKKAQPAVRKLESAHDVEEFIAVEDTGVVLYSTDDDAAAAFERVAQSFEKFGFGAVSDAALFGDNAEGTVALHRSFADGVLTRDGTDDLSDWLNDNGFPPITEIDQDSFQRLAPLAKPIVIMVIDYDDAEAKDKWLKFLTNAADEFPAVSITYGPTATLGRAVESFGGTGDVIPTLIGMKTPGLDQAEDDVPAKNLPERFAFDENNEVNEETAAAFLKDVADGTLQPYKKSEPVPESNDGPVTVLVHNNFDDFVKEGNNVFIKFYAPWCGHCKSLAPVWEELGEAFADTDNVYIAKIDATANFVDAGYGVQGFPTLVFVSADGSQETYSGGRTLEDLKEFVSSKL